MFWWMYGKYVENRTWDLRLWICVHISDVKHVAVTRSCAVKNCKLLASCAIWLSVFAALVQFTGTRALSSGYKTTEVLPNQFFFFKEHAWTRPNPLSVGFCWETEPQLIVGFYTRNDSKIFTIYKAICKKWASSQEVQVWVLSHIV